MNAEMWMELLGSAAVEGIILGAILGFLWSMASKVLQWFLIGEFLLLKWLESRGILVVDWERLTLGLVENGNKAIEEAVTLLESFIELGTFGASFVVGFWIVNKLKA